MSEYLILAPCLYTNDDGTVTQQRKAGVVVEISDDVAAKLGAAVERLADAPPAKKVSRPRGKKRSATRVSVDGVDQGEPQVGTRPDDAPPGELIDAPGNGEPISGPEGGGSDG